jgi:hypothetical protein
MSLFIKTLAKPMAKQVKHQFVKQPMTRSWLIWVGQTAHATTTRMTIWSSGYKVRSISKIEDEAALSRGADLLSESFIFSVSVAILMYEYNRSNVKEEKKRAAKMQLIRDNATKLQAKLDSLDKRLVSLEEYAKANRNDNDQVQETKSTTTKDSAAAGKNSSEKVTQQSKRWWWPF